MNKEKFVGHKINELIGYTIGKTSLNMYIDTNSLESIINKISIEYSNPNDAFKIYSEYVKKTFIDSLKFGLQFFFQMENLNKVAFNDTFIKDNYDLFEELGFTIKILSDDELQNLFPSKSSDQKEELRYYAFIPKEKYFSIYG